MGSTGPRSALGMGFLPPSTELTRPDKNLLEKQKNQFCLWRGIGSALWEGAAIPKYIPDHVNLGLSKEAATGPGPAAGEEPPPPRMRRRRGNVGTAITQRAAS